MNNRHRRYGFNAAQELAQRVDLRAEQGSGNRNERILHRYRRGRHQPEGGPDGRDGAAFWRQRAAPWTSGGRRPLRRTWRIWRRRCSPPPERRPGTRRAWASACRGPSPAERCCTPPTSPWSGRIWRPCSAGGWTCRCCWATTRTAAVGEYFQGAGRGLRDFVVLTWAPAWGPESF